MPTTAKALTATVSVPSPAVPLAVFARLASTVAHAGTVLAPVPVPVTTITTACHPIPPTTVSKEEFLSGLTTTDELNSTVEQSHVPRSNHLDVHNSGTRQRTISEDMCQ